MAPSRLVYRVAIKFVLPVPNAVKTAVAKLLMPLSMTFSLFMTPVVPFHYIYASSDPLVL